MADVAQANQASAGSYKEKLLKQSEQDELSHPDQSSSLPKLPPTKDAGSPPMTVQEVTEPRSTAEAPAGDNDGFIPVTSGPQGAVKATQPATATADDSTTTADAENQEQQQVNISEAAPESIAGAALSDIEQQVITDPSTKDLVEAATQPDTAAIKTDAPPANVVVHPDESSNVNRIEGDATTAQPGNGTAVSPESTEADATAAEDNATDDTSKDSSSAGNPLKAVTGTVGSAVGQVGSAVGQVGGAVGSAISKMAGLVLGGGGSGGSKKEDEEATAGDMSSKEVEQSEAGSADAKGQKAAEPDSHPVM